MTVYNSLKPMIDDWLKMLFFPRFYRESRPLEPDL